VATQLFLTFIACLKVLLMCWFVLLQQTLHLHLSAPQSSLVLPQAAASLGQDLLSALTF
jgi:hypothetical protein